MKFTVILALVGLVASQSLGKSPTRPPPKAKGGSSRSPPKAANPQKTTQGPAVSVGPTKNQIIGVETVIIPGVVPKRQEGQLFLWTSIFNTAAPKGDTISTVLEADPDSERACNAPHGYWCLQPQVRQPSKSTSALDRPIAVAPDARIRIEYLKTNDGASWIQRTIDMKTGLQIHNYVNGVGKMTGWTTGTEMVGPRGTVGTQYYTETVIKLQAPDPAFGSKIKKTGAATFTGLRSEEDGRVWKIDAITIPPTLHNN